MKHHYGVLFVFFLPMIIMVLIGGCEGEKPLDATLHFNPEYDFVAGYDIFPGSGGNHNFNYVATVFDNANTVFSPYVGIPNEIAAGGYFDNVNDIYAFVRDHAECYLDGDLNCVRIHSNLKKLAHKSYLAGVVSYSDANTLGITLNGGKEYEAICMIFVQNIINKANSWPADATALREGTVIHELGHARDSLTHLCLGNNGMNVDTENHDHNQSYTCIMAGDLLDVRCMVSGGRSPIDGYQFCGKCIDNLKNTQW